ncbi:MAG: amylo-alpha-1,6-glucosidase [Gemmatimonadaceae bacterium]
MKRTSSAHNPLWSGAESALFENPRARSACDGDAPHTPRSCPFQAWSVGELLRIGARTSRQPLA